MGTWPASIRGEVGRALPLLNRLDPLHSAAVAAQGHHATYVRASGSASRARPSSSFPHLYLLHAANDNVVIYGSQQCWQAGRGGRRPAKACQTSYSMPDLGRIPSPLPVDRWKSPGLATAGACGSLEVTAGWKKCIPFGRITALAVMILMLKRTHGHAWSALKHWLLIYYLRNALKRYCTRQCANGADVGLSTICNVNDRTTHKTSRPCTAYALRFTNFTRHRAPTSTIPAHYVDRKSVV